MNPDFVDFLRVRLAADARFLVVDAHAPAVHRVPRATGDIDIWVERSLENAAPVWRALESLGEDPKGSQLSPSPPTGSGRDRHRARPALP